MPVVTPQERPVAVADESAYRAPRKTVTASTGMDLKKSFSGAPVEEIRQENKPEETSQIPKEVTLSPQLTALARKEAKFRQQEQAFKAEQQKLAEEKAKVVKLLELESKLASKDYSVLDEIGVSYEEWTKYLINKGESEKPEVQAIRKLESEIDGIKKANEQSVTKQYEATVNQYKRDIKNLIDSNPEFDSVKTMKAEDHVLQHILDTFNEDGDILSVEQAAKEIEEHLVEEALEMAKLKRVQERLAPKVEEKRQLPPPKSGLRTLSNQVTQSTPSVPRNQFQHMSMKERIAAAVAKSQK